jgi:hypothetical protein
MAHIERWLKFPYCETGSLLGRVVAFNIHVPKGFLFWRRIEVVFHWSMELHIPGPDARYNSARVDLDGAQVELLIESLEKAKIRLSELKKTSLGEIHECISSMTVSQPNIVLVVDGDSSLVVFRLFSKTRLLSAAFSTKELSGLVRELRKALKDRLKIKQELDDMDAREGKLDGLPE